jgi:hypothetical protein
VVVVEDPGAVVEVEPGAVVGVVVDGGAVVEVEVDGGAVDVVVAPAATTCTTPDM